MKKISKFIDTVNIIEVVKFLNNRLEIPEKPQGYCCV